MKYHFFFFFSWTLDFNGRILFFVETLRLGNWIKKKLTVKSLYKNILFLWVHVAVSCCLNYAVSCVYDSALSWQWELWTKLFRFWPTNINRYEVGSAKSFGASNLKRLTSNLHLNCYNILCCLIVASMSEIFSLRNSKISYFILVYVSFAWQSQPSWEKLLKHLTKNYSFCHFVIQAELNIFHFSLESLLLLQSCNLHF